MNSKIKLNQSSSRAGARAGTKLGNIKYIFKSLAPKQNSFEVKAKL